MPHSTPALHDLIAKAREERKHKHGQKNDGSIVQSVIGAIKSTLSSAENTATEKTSYPEQGLEETTEAGENGDDEDEDYNTAQFACT